MSRKQFLWVSPEPPWSQWSNSGFIRSICLELKNRGLLYGAFSPKESSLLTLRGPGVAYDLRRRIANRIFPTHISSERMNVDESSGLLGKVLRNLSSESFAIYQYMYPKIDRSLKHTRLLFQDITVREAVETASYEYESLSRNEIAAKIDEQKKGLEDADGVITFSNYAADSIVEEYGFPREKIVAIGAGPVRSPRHVKFDLDRYAQGRLLFIGRQWERKGGPMLLEAFKIVRDQVPHATLTIAGAQIDPPNQDGVHYLGSVSNQQIAQLFAKSSIFSMPARCETWGLVYTEAAASGLPIVGFSAWAMPDIVKTGVSGILLGEQSAEALAHALIGLLREPERMASMGRAAQSYMQSTLDWPHVVDRLVAKFMPDALDGRSAVWMNEISPRSRKS